MSGDPDQDYFSDGVADDIITELSRNRHNERPVPRPSRHLLFVIARNSSFTYKGGAVVQGSVRRVGNQIRIAAQLLDAETGGHVWAERFDRELADIFEMQDEIAHLLVTAIDPAISQVEQERVMRKSPENLSAWEAWQRALWHWAKRDLPGTRDALERTVTLDLRFAPAYAVLSWVRISEVARGGWPAMGRGHEASGGRGPNCRRPRPR